MAQCLGGGPRTTGRCEFSPFTLCVSGCPAWESVLYLSIPLTQAGGGFQSLGFHLRPFGSRFLAWNTIFIIPSGDKKNPDLLPHQM